MESEKDVIESVMVMARVLNIQIRKRKISASAWEDDRPMSFSVYPEGGFVAGFPQAQSS